MGACCGKGRDGDGAGGKAAAENGGGAAGASGKAAAAPALPEHLVARRRVVFEVLQTERSYVRDLEALLTLYYAPLGALAQQGTFKGFGMAELGKLFGNVEEIYKLHVGILAEMGERVLLPEAGGKAAKRRKRDKKHDWEAELTAGSPADADPRCNIGALFHEARIAELKRVYSAFVLNYNASIAVLSKLQCNALYTEWSARQEDGKTVTVESRLERPGQTRTRREHAPSSAAPAMQVRKLDLPSYLIMPIQRVPRYELLFREVNKNTDRASGEFPDAELVALDAAAHGIRDVARHINQRKRQVEAASRILAIQKQVGNSLSLVEEGRLLVLDGLLTVRSSISGSKEFKPQFMMLFSDALMWTSPAKRKRLKGIFLLENAVLSYEPLDGAGPSVDPSQLDGESFKTHALRVRGFDRLLLKHVDVDFRFGSLDEHNRWRSHIDEAQAAARAASAAAEANVAAE